MRIGCKYYKNGCEVLNDDFCNNKCSEFEPKPEGANAPELLPAVRRSQASIDDVREALWQAYKKAEKREYGIEGKSGEAYTELIYDTYWNCKTVDEFKIPIGIKIYSYALGPSRSHYFYRAGEYKEVNYYTWEGQDIFQLAIDKINAWVDDLA